MNTSKYMDTTTGPLAAVTRVLQPKTSGPWMFTLNYARPPKGLHANDRAHWAVKAGATADIRLEVMAKVRALRIGTLEHCTVQVVWVVGDKRKRDTDNLAPFMKAIFDGIGSNSKGYSAHLVDDDDPEHMSKPGAQIRYDRGTKPFFEITITAEEPNLKESSK